ncbi:hypothetical protein Acr_17g0012910 [Actinidia rufa]|uniref:Bifunctional inhibitor/lipid-transfer protein/seed storage 2S albumin superfamily protein n=1 Tax=Actinidia rufa TaxID=165716 RepID=A0A7J0G4L9_9ERIC|nr:hypothetical protein Acr_17g0012900 [Actinidia rufa]GFZ05719.1 hypothetical protein Acr_17g0012910 [Actinidia rufa]
MGFPLWVSGLVLLVLVVSPTGYSLECVDALTPLIPCLGFLTGSGPDVLDPNGPCCQGAQQLDNIAANSQPDRQAISFELSKKGDVLTRE